MERASVEVAFLILRVQSNIIIIPPLRPLLALNDDGVCEEDDKEVGRRKYLCRLVTDDPGEFPDQSNRLKDWNQ
jgi:hypothetical protein